MAYDERMAERVRKLLKRRKGITERKMFGGLAFLLNGNMCCGIIEKDLMLRLGEEGAAKALKRGHTREMDFTGKPLKTMVYVSAAGYRSDDQLRGWVNQAISFVKTLPTK
jgi:TfoX/Sxy family transcriptional regulator of competence genes